MEKNIKNNMWKHGRTKYTGKWHILLNRNIAIYGREMQINKLLQIIYYLWKFSKTIYLISYKIFQYDTPNDKNKLISWTIKMKISLNGH